MMRTLQDIDVNGKKVLVRVDFNVPVNEDGTIIDDSRIQVSVPTIKQLLDSGASQVILVTHMGRPKGKEKKLQTDAVAARTGEMLGESVAKVDDWGENGIPEDKVVFLENTRFNPAEKSKNEKERDEFGKQLARLADVFVQDAFSNCHRDHASMTSVPKFIPGCAGLNVEKEVSTITDAIQNPKKPVVAIMGGLKADKLNVVHFLLPNVDHIVLGGSLGFVLVKEEGVEIGKTKIDAEGMTDAKELVEELRNSGKALLPVDALVATEISDDADTKTVTIQNIPSDQYAVDIGPETLKAYEEVITKAKTILWFGPMGAFEFKKFALATEEIAQLLAKSSASVIVGGGDSANAVQQLGLSDKMTLVSTGGGASLTLAQGKELVALQALV